MRLLGAFGIGLLAMNGAAHASSIVVVGPSTSTPSVVRLDAIDPAKLSALSAPSMIALGDPVPAVTDEKVAAIPEKAGHQPAPMIIRCRASARRCRSHSIPLRCARRCLSERNSGRGATAKSPSLTVFTLFLELLSLSDSRHPDRALSRWRSMGVS
ncbi:MAG: hypothetical protein EOS60_30520 [Mesorhizobium sp.]|nr:MAG: hypothetical protein EOS60_30520 [Mesorhizobium sp.]